jgi:hypothetical protein
MGHAIRPGTGRMIVASVATNVYGACLLAAWQHNSAKEHLSALDLHADLRAGSRQASHLSLLQ